MSDIGYGSIDQPFHEALGLIVEVHWPRRHVVCGGAATATGVGLWPFNGTVGYSGTGDLTASSPLNLFAGACRPGQPWTIEVECVLGMILGPLHLLPTSSTDPDLVHYTKDATYSADFELWLVEGGVLSTMLGSTSLAGSLHNESISRPGAPGDVVFDEATGSISAAGTGPAVFAVVSTFSASPDPTDPTANGTNVGGGATFGAASVTDSP